MKIIIVVHALTGGGAERVAASWANGLTVLGHNVSILTATDRTPTYATDPKVRIIERNGVKGNSLKAKIIRKLFGGLVAWRQMHGLMRREHPDAVVHVLYLHHFATLAARLTSGSHAKVIMTDHNTYEVPAGVKRPRKQWRNKLFDNRFFDTVTVLCDVDRKIMEQKGFTNFETLHNPLFLKPVEKIPEKEKTVLAVGRMRNWYVKGFDLLARGWKDVNSKHPDWKLRIVGKIEPDIMQKLKELAGESVNSIEFIDYTPDVADEYRRASIFVLSSRYEGWGLVAVEAMSQGCATIACDYKGRQAEFIQDGNNGLLIQPGNATAIADAINKLIADAPLRQRLQQESPRHLGEFSELNTARRLEKLLS